MTYRLLLAVPDEAQRGDIHDRLLASELFAGIAEAATGSAAMDVLRGDFFDCVLLNHTLPDRDGETLLLDMVTNHNSNAAMIFADEQYDRETALRVLRAGAAEYVSYEQLAGDRLECAFLHAIARQSFMTRLRDLGHFDALTKLPNRTFFEKEIGTAIAQANRTGRLLALILVNLDNFKHINDQHGHLSGDAILRMVAERLRATVRETDFVARIGGDEFAIIAQNLISREGAAEIGAKLIGVFPEGFEVDGKRLRATASIGISLFPVDGRQPMTLMNCADQALYRAKSSERGSCCLFVDGNDARVSALPQGS